MFGLKGWFRLTTVFIAQEPMMAGWSTMWRIRKDKLGFVRNYALMSSALLAQYFMILFILIGQCTALKSQVGEKRITPCIHV